MSSVRNNLKERVRRAMIIIALVAAIDGAGVFFAGKPVLWASTAPLLIPVLFGIFIIIPMTRTAKG